MRCYGADAAYDSAPRAYYSMLRYAFDAAFVYTLTCAYMPLRRRLSP